MNRLIIVIVFILLNLSLANARSEPCKPGNPKNSTYLLRENDRRCEGIITPQVSNDFDLISFSIGQLQPADLLTLQIPKVASLPQPIVRIQSRRKYYQLDPLELKDRGKQWQFQWTSEVLQQESIPLSSLRALALSEKVVIPIFLNKLNSPAYTVHIYTGGRVTTMTINIQRDGNILYSQTLTDRPGDEIKWTWNGLDRQGKIVPPGRYTLSITAKVQQRNAPDEERYITQQFEHNPAWLK